MTGYKNKFTHERYFWLMSFKRHSFFPYPITRQLLTTNIPSFLLKICAYDQQILILPSPVTAIHSAPMSLIFLHSTSK
jgi:hypothetical protein